MGYNKKQCGIYCFKNILNEKRYIGQSVSMLERRDQHLRDLEKGKHHSFHFQRAYDKYGKENFIHEILLECSEENLEEQEIKFMKTFKTDNRKFGYNIKKDGQKFSKESREKLSKSLTNNPKVIEARKRTWLTRPRNKINQYDLQGNFIKTWNSTTEVSKELNITDSCIRKICTQTHGLFSAKNFMFRDYKGNINNIDPCPSKANKNNCKPKRIKKIFSREVECYCKETKLLLNSYKNCAEAGRQLKLDSSTIRKCCIGQNYYYKNYIFKYK